MTLKDLNKIRDYIVTEIVREPLIMFDDTVRGDDEYQKIDLIEVIVTLYNLLHKEVTGEDYEYFFHWANKIGAWLEEDAFKDILGGDDNEG